MKKKLSKTNSSKTYQQFYAHVHSKAHSPRSREAYLRWVERIGEHYQPDGPGLRRLSERQVLDYLIYLRDDQKLATSTVNQALAPIQTLYRDVSERDWRLWSQSPLTASRAASDGAQSHKAAASAVLCACGTHPIGAVSGLSLQVALS
jgi:site-specific recombinase XerD